MMPPDIVVVRPNDRLIRTIVILVVMTWWGEEAAVLVRDGAAPLTVVCLCVLLFTPIVWFLAWIAVGRWVFEASNGDLIVHRCLAMVTFWSTTYSVTAIRGFRVEEQRKKIKGNMSLRYRVLMEMVSGAREIAWFREITDAETLATQLQALTGIPASRSPLGTAAG